MHSEQVTINVVSKGPLRIDYQTDGSAGMDLPYYGEIPITIPSNGRALIPIGISIAIPPGYEGQVRSRSGLAMKHGLMVLNSPGTIDSDYRGEVKVILYNSSSQEYTVYPNDRVAQLVIAKTPRVVLQAVKSLDSTDRGKGGMGHTGR